MTAAVIVLTYLTSVVLAARILGRMIRAHDVRTHPRLHRNGWKPGDGDYAMICFFAVTWPVSLPMTYLHTRPSRDREHSATSAASVFLFGPADPS